MLISLNADISPSHKDAMEIFFNFHKIEVAQNSLRHREEPLSPNKKCRVQKNRIYDTWVVCLVGR
jgi:hypothetical protein